MLINPYTGVINSALSSAKNSSGKLEKAMMQIASGNRIARAADDVSTLSLATQLQNQIAGLRSSLSNASLASSQLQVADNDIGQIQNVLGRMKEISTQANSGALNDDGREMLNVEFKQLTDEISRIAGSSSFNGNNLLDGSLSGDNAISINDIFGEGSVDDDVALEVDALDAATLFGGNLDISTQVGAENALNVIQQAFNTVGTARASVGSFQEEVGYASAFVETAIANQEAARSVLTDTDFADAATALSQADAQRQMSLAVAAQSKRLPPSMLELLS